MREVDKLIKELKKSADKTQAKILQRFFKTAEGQYGAGDIFLGIRGPVIHKISKQYIDLDLKDISVLLKDKIHELRTVALFILVEKYQKTSDRKLKKEIVDFYLKHAKYINNWDLVDLSVYKILGDYLILDKNKIETLDKLAESKNLWQRRMAMISTYAFIRAGSAEETLRMAKKLLKDEHDLMHKAVGWMLREAGKRIDEKILTDFLDKYAPDMPRTALRYAIERLEPKKREKYLKK